MSGHEAEARAIRELVAGAVELVRAKDFNSIAEAYTPNGQLLLAGEPVASGPDAVRQAWAKFIGDMPGLKIEYGPVEIKFSATADVAVEVGRYDLSYDTPNGRVRDLGKYVVVWLKDNGSWKIDVDIINSDLAAPAPVKERQYLEA